MTAARVSLASLRADVTRPGGALPARIPLSVFPSVRVHPTRSWPAVGNAVVGTTLADPTTVYHTTQPAVYGRPLAPEWRGHTVEDKIRRLRAGEPLVVDVVYRDDDATWVFNGHHTLVGYLILGRRPLVAVHDPKRGQRLDPPRLVVAATDRTPSGVTREGLRPGVGLGAASWT